MWEYHDIGQVGSRFDYPVLLHDGSIVVLDSTSFENRQNVKAFDLNGNEIWSNSFDIEDCRNCYVIASAPMPGDGFAVAWRDGYELTNVEFVGKVGMQGDKEWTHELPYRGKLATHESKMINGRLKSPGKVIWIPQPGKSCSPAFAE
jgi:hypothetical protein